jgi:exonuclease SbcD
VAAPLRLLHTSDWHLGQLFFGHDRAAEHQCFLDWLLQILGDEAIDVLLIAGDVYDQAHPAASTQKQFYRFLVAARQRCPQLQIIVIAGNHDSPARLEAPGPLLDELGIRVVGHYDCRAPQQLLLPLSDASGTTVAWCLAVPYLRPSELPQRVGDALDAAPDGVDAYVSAVSQVYAQLTALAVAQRQPGQALIAMGHLHVRGGRTSEESERRLVVGGVEALDANIFDPALAYVALGHLHLAQSAAAGRVRYCGSPLPLSFTELDYPHQVLCLTLQAEQLHEVRTIAVPRFVELLKVPQQPVSVEEALAALAALDLPAVATGLQPFVEVQIRLDQPEPTLGARIHAALDGKAVRFTRIRSPQHAFAGAAADAAETELRQLADLQQLNPSDLLAAHYQRLYAQALPPSLAQAFAELLREHQE